MYMYNMSPLILTSLAQNKEMVEYACKGDKRLKQKFYSELRALEEKQRLEKEELENK